MKKNIIVAIFLSLLLPGVGLCQSLAYAREVVNKLASEDFKGRGYVENGEKIAASYIGKEFEKIGLLPIKKSYFQNFSTPVNTFPALMELSLNGIIMHPGTDYLIDAGSPGINGNYKTEILAIEDAFDRKSLSKKLLGAKDKFVVMPAYNKSDFSKEQQQELTRLINFLKYSPENPSKGSIILTYNKLTWDASTLLYSKPSFTVLVDSTSESVSEEIRTVNVSAENKFIRRYKTQNVVGYLEGERQDSLIVLVAHYDHLGAMGTNTIFTGANDNASGVAMLLNLAKYYKAHKPTYRTIFIAFGGEELGLIGSQFFVNHPLFKLSKIKFLLNFDISGTGDDGIQVVNGSIYRDKFDLLSKINNQQNLLKQVKIRGEACNSDHCFFYKKNVPCFFIYTLGGIQAYHDVYDRAETLPLTEFEDYFKLIAQFIDKL